MKSKINLFPIGVALAFVFTLHLFSSLAVGVLFKGRLSDKAIASVYAFPRFVTIKLPTGYLPGDRLTVASVDMNGESRRNVSVWVYYSDRKAALNNLSDSLPRGQASCKNAANGNLTCTFIFPHTIHDRPNILTQQEIDGGPPLERRPTYADLKHAETLADLGVPNQSLRYVVTDKNPKRFLASDDVYCRWVIRGMREGNIQSIEDEIREFKMPRRLTIATLGDSYAAGEGAPNIEGPATSQRWTDEPCHRSEKSGQVRAIKQFRRNNPEVAMAYLNVACSGAEIDDGLRYSQTDLSGEQVFKPSQLKAVNDWMEEKNRKTLDLLLLSIGGNDVGFGYTGFTCFTEVGNCSSSAQFRRNIATAMADLPERYADLNNSLKGWDTLNVLKDREIGRVFITEYPDPLHGSDGQFCNEGGPQLYGLCWGPVEYSVSAADFRFLDNELLTALNREVKAAAGTHGWEYIGGAADRSRLHGLCNCNDGYFNTVAQSFWAQGDQNGSVHPNRNGHKEIYQPLIYQAFQTHLDRLRSEADLRLARERFRLGAEVEIADFGLHPLKRSSAKIPTRQPVKRLFKFGSAAALPWLRNQKPNKQIAEFQDDLDTQPQGPDDEP